MLNIKEIFFSIQGEGPFAGTPAWFIRLAECGLNCKECDTDYLRGTILSDDEIILQIKENKSGCTLIVLTGGEPLEQNISSLILKITEELKHSYVQIETSGYTCHKENLKILDLVTIVCSPKTLKLNKELLPEIDYFKYVVRAGECDNDGLPCSVMTGHPNIKTVYRNKESLKSRPESIYLSPMDEKDPVKNLENLKFASFVCMKNNWKLSVQIHKLAELR